MFSWGQDCVQGFRRKDGTVVGNSAGDGPRFLQLGYHVSDLSVGERVVAFTKTNGNSFIIRTNKSREGAWVRGRQKFVKFREKIQAVGCGDDTVTLLTERGKVLSVDANTYIPRPLEALLKIEVCQVACGSQHSVALSRDGQVFTWGQDSRGQLGLGKRRPGAISPQALSSLSGIPLVQVAAGGEQSFALSVSGGVFSWGANTCGQLGLGDKTDRNTPTAVNYLNMKKTVHISCGKEHTAILTKDGAVFTFGSGQYGQLGHVSFSDEVRPRLVAEFWGSKVTKTACGRHHTLVLTDSKKVYSFGRGEQWQLGHGEESHPSVPLPVLLPQDSADDLKIRNIFAGGNCSYATCTTNEEVEPMSASTKNVTQPCFDDLVGRWISECDSKSWKKIKLEIHRTFSSSSCLNGSFLEQSKDKHFQTSPKFSGLNLSQARLTFKKLVKKDNVWEEAEAAILHLLRNVDKKPVGVEGLRVYLLLIELLSVIHKHKSRQTNTKLAEAVAAAVLSLSDDSLRVIGDWWSPLSPSTMRRHVQVWKQALSVVLSFDPVPRNSGVKNLLLVLQYMYNVNSRIAEHRRIPDSYFHLLLSNRLLEDDVFQWILRCQHKKRRAEPIIICRFPFVMNVQAKMKVFFLNAEYTKLEAILNGIFEELSYFMPQKPCFALHLRRSSVLEDTFEQLAEAEDTEFELPLLVFFDGNPTVDMVNNKDFFYEVFHEMMTAESGMFMFNDSETLAWFPSKVTQEDQRYFHFGVLCGLALYNSCIIFLPFPLALFKKLLGIKPSLEDMMEFSPCVGKRLQYILEEEEDVEGLEFSISWGGMEVDLDPENPEKLVTSQNKKEFVDAYVNHAFNTSVEGVFQEFERGFFQVCERSLVMLFQPKELKDVLVGKDFHDWAKLKENTVYEGEFHEAHPTIQMFWEVFDEMSEEQKKAFLWFVTGFDKLPIGGMETIKMNVRVLQVQDLSHDHHRPGTHTCFSDLELPLYSSKEIMQTKLKEALSCNKRIKQ